MEENWQFISYLTYYSPLYQVHCQWNVSIWNCYIKNESGAFAPWDNSLDFDWVVASLPQIGSNKIFTVLANTLYTHRRMSILFLGQQAFKLTNPACVQCSFHCRSAGSKFFCYVCLLVLSLKFLWRTIMWKAFGMTRLQFQTPYLSAL